jgi:hypothetical protein
MLERMVVATCEIGDLREDLFGRLAWYRRLPRRPEAWYAAFAIYAGAVALFSGLGQDRWWGVWACAGYAVAAVLAGCWRGPRGRLGALAAALAGGLAWPLTWLATWRPATPDVTVVMRSGILLLHHGSPYLGPAQLAHGGWLAYDPYLPVMAVFGLPKALGLPGVAGDPRPWLAAVTFGLLVVAFRAAALRGSLRGAAFLLASPVLAFPLAMGITDPPIIALTCLAIALAARRGMAGAGVVTGVVCAMKETAWPAAAVLAVMIAARYGGREAARFVSRAAATSLALIAALAPAALAHPGGLLENTVAYPLGLTSARSPAQSPLPGHLLSVLGPLGHRAAIALLITAMLGIAVWLLVRPPVTAGAAVCRVALTLSLMFALCPATRFGYFAYPAALGGWYLLTRDGVPAATTLSAAFLPFRRAARVEA